MPDSAYEVFYDVVIAGGGMVGASLALSLARHGEGRMRVLVVESFPLPSDAGGGPPPYRPSFDARSTALSYGSEQIYRKLGIWSLLEQHACPIATVHVSDRGHFGSVSMSAEEQGWPTLGHVIENPWLGSVLLGAVRGLPGVEFRAPARLLSAAVHDDHASLSLQEGDVTSEVRAALLIVADGAESGLRQQLGVNADVRDYRQMAVIANVATEKHHGGRAFERFTEYGALALLPLTRDERGDSRSALVWTFDPSQAEAASQWSDEAFLAALQSHFGFRLGRLKKVGQRAQFPLRLTQSEEQVRRRLVIVGNAAHSLHPVAGQGFNLALRDVSVLSQLLCEVHAGGGDPGDLAILQRYQQRQETDQWLTTTFSDRLMSVFGNRRPSLSLARNLGLLALDILPPAKSRFVAQTAGMAGN